MLIIGDLNIPVQKICSCLKSLNMHIWSEFYLFIYFCVYVCFISCMCVCVNVCMCVCVCLCKCVKMSERVSVLDCVTKILWIEFTKYVPPLKIRSKNKWRCFHKFDSSCLWGRLTNIVTSIKLSMVMQYFMIVSKGSILVSSWIYKYELWSVYCKIQCLKMTMTLKWPFLTLFDL